MKKSILVVVGTCFVALGSFAQVKPSTNRGGFIIKGGVNSANITISDNGSVDQAKALTSFHVGVAVDVPLSEGLSLVPGLIYTGKGTKSQQGSESGSSYYRATSNPMYLELPVNLVGKIPLGGVSKLLIGVGPYAAMGVAGKNKTEGKVFGVAFNSENDIKYSNDDPTTAQEENGGFGKLKRFDYGLNALAGVDFGKVSLTAGYGYGFVKINSGTRNRDDENNKHRVLSLSLGLKL